MYEKRKIEALLLHLQKLVHAQREWADIQKDLKKADESRKEDLVVLINGFWRKFKMPKRILLHEEFEEIQPYSTCCWL